MRNELQVAEQIRQKRGIRLVIAIFASSALIILYFLFGHFDQSLFVIGMEYIFCCSIGVFVPVYFIAKAKRFSLIYFNCVGIILDAFLCFASTDFHACQKCTTQMLRNWHEKDLASALNAMYYSLPAAIIYASSFWLIAIRNMDFLKRD